MWATQSERDERFHDETFAEFEFRVRDEWDNGEFMTGATVDLFERGKLVHSEAFVASSEFPPGGEFSAYGNGRGNYALTQACSYGWSWVDARETPLEERLGPWGIEWEREQMEVVYAG